MVESELASGTVEIFDVSMGHAIKHRVYNSFGNALYRKTVMKILSGAIFLVGAEQAFAHAMLVQFPNQSTASAVLIPASVVMLAMGGLLVLWGLWVEMRAGRGRHSESVANLRDAS